MIPATFIASITLILVGLIGYFWSESASLTALIPTWFGVALALCGALACKRSLHKAALTIAMLLGALGFVAAAMRLPKSYDAWQVAGCQTCPLAFISQACMTVITLLYVVVGIRAYLNRTKE